MILIWLQLFEQIMTFICQLLKENLVIQLITNLKMQYSSSGHDQRTKHIHTNTHHAPTQLLDFNNVGSFHGLANDTPSFMLFSHGFKMSMMSVAHMW
jgi:hypothetical protein